MSPCSRCNGSGTEPDPLPDAIRDLDQTIGIIVTDQQVADILKDKLITVAGTARHVIDDAGARVTFLEAALRDILGRFGAPQMLLGDEQFLRVPNEDVENWRKILDGGDG